MNFIMWYFIRSGSLSLMPPPDSLHPLALLYLPITLSWIKKVTSFSIIYSCGFWLVNFLRSCVFLTLNFQCASRRHKKYIITCMGTCEVSQGLSRKGKLWGWGKGNKRIREMVTGKLWFDVFFISPLLQSEKKKVDDMNLLKKINIVWKDGITFDENLFDGFWINGFWIFEKSRRIRILSCHIKFSLKN